MGSYKVTGHIVEEWMVNNNISFNADQLAKLDLFADELLHWNKKVNLTAITGLNEVRIKHFIDSLSLLKVIGAAESLLDVGSGGGFPCLPIAIMRPELAIRSIDAVEKKINFQRHICRKLGIKNLDPVHGRVENLPGNPKYDLIVSRAFTDIDRFVELVERLMSRNGAIILMCGPEQNSDEKSLQPLMRKYQLAIRDNIKNELPAGAGTRKLVVLARQAA